MYYRKFIAIRFFALFGYDFAPFALVLFLFDRRTRISSSSLPEGDFFVAFCSSVSAVVGGKSGLLLTKFREDRRLPREFITSEEESRVNPASEENVMKNTPQDVQLAKILVPVDFSECSRSAVQFAAGLAKRFGSELVLVHVVDVYLGTGDMLLDMVRIQADVEKEAKERLEQWANELQPQPKIIVRTGPPAYEILEAAREIGATAIVIPSHGRGAIARFFIGGVADRVVRHAACPVIVLPWNKRFVETQSQASTVPRASRAEQRQTAAQPRRQYEPFT